MDRSCTKNNSGMEKARVHCGLQHVNDRNSLARCKKQVEVGNYWQYLMRTHGWFSKEEGQGLDICGVKVGGPTCRQKRKVFIKMKYDWWKNSKRCNAERYASNMTQCTGLVEIRVQMTWSVEVTLHQRHKTEIRHRWCSNTLKLMHMKALTMDTMISHGNSYAWRTGDAQKRAASKWTPEYS